MPLDIFDGQGDRMNVLVTGVTGRIGANVAARLVAQGHSVRGLVWPRDPRIAKLQGVELELMEGSLIDVDDTVRAADGMDVVYHLGAAFQGGGPFSERDYFEINVTGTLNMLEAARAQKGLQHFVYAGTDAVYSKYMAGGVADPIREDVTPVAPTGWYALSKYLGEQLCSGYWRTYKIPTTTLRFSYVVGPGEILDFGQFYLSKLKSNPDLAPLWQGEERLVLLRDANGKPYRKHVADVQDIVHGCLCVLGRAEAAGEVMQLGGPGAFTWDVAVPHLSERTGIPYIEASPKSTPTSYEFDLSKARRLIGFDPQCDIVRMIDDAIAFREGKDIGVLPVA
jgi:UDP-glucose 4-epimerase